MPTILSWRDILPEETFFKKGLAENDEMLFPFPLQDRQLLRKILLHGGSEFKLSKLVDLYHVVQSTGAGKDKKRKKVRPTIAKAILFSGKLCGPNTHCSDHSVFARVVTDLWGHMQSNCIKGFMCAFTCEIAFFKLSSMICNYRGAFLAFAVTDNKARYSIPTSDFSYRV